MGVHVSRNRSQSSHKQCLCHVIQCSRSVSSLSLIYPLFSHSNCFPFSLIYILPSYLLYLALFSSSLSLTLFSIKFRNSLSLLSLSYHLSLSLSLSIYISYPRLYLALSSLSAVAVNQEHEECRQRCVVEALRDSVPSRYSGPDINGGHACFVRGTTTRCTAVRSRLQGTATREFRNLASVYMRFNNMSPIFYISYSCIVIIDLL